ncbi:GAF domain-containing protein [Candidatus Leptofilum sp.]|uniref:GAF domain-containing protein n=1 Tax=Candidatus Leptofilum sp. TaxID=3241576 RepID=UPI003B5C682C
MNFNTILQFRHYSLRTKLAIVFVIFSIASVAGVSLSVTRTMESALTQQVGEVLSVEAKSQRDVINLFFHEKVGQIQLLSFTDVVREPLAVRNESYSGSPEEILAGIEALDAQWVAAGDDDPLIRSVIIDDANVNATAAQLHDISREFPEHIEVFVTDRYGATVASSNRLSDYYQADEGWWQSAWADGEGAIYISDPEFDESANANALLIAVPVYADDGEVIGVVRTTLVVDTLFALIGQLRFGDTGHAVLFNAAGNVLFDPFATQDADTAELPSELVQSFLTTEATYNIATDEHGDEAVFGHSPLHTEAEVDRSDRSLAGQIATGILDLGWVVVARQEASEALASVTTLNRTIQLVGLGIVGLATAVAFVMAGTVTRPILALNKATEAIAAGNLDVALPTGSKDEIGQLTGNFQQMMTRLRQSLGSLQARSHDLELVVDVGREMTQVQDLENMLQNAVNIIRDRFNLYYAQIYLADPAGNSLILRAGTGEAGQQLVSRGHRLPVGSGSINGTAAASGQAVLVTDTTASAGHRANPLLPDTRSEMAIPLLVDEKLVGVLDLQSNEVEGLTDENIPGFTALAAQLAVAIQNATLFSETQQARAEVEAYSQQLAQQGWQGFLNGIDRSQHLAAAYDLSHETALSDIPELAEDEHEVAVPITVAGASVGAIRLADYEGREWTEDEAEMLTAVAEKVSHHIENLRLLTEAEKYRMEAESVVRRLTREGWQSYHDAAKLQASGFIYDQQEVMPLQEALEETAVIQPLLVRGEAIGELAISGLDNNEGSQAVLQAITQKISERLEALRLNEEVERRASDLVTVAEVSTATATTLETEHLLQAVSDLTKERFGFYHAHIYLKEQDELVLAAGAGEVGRQMTAEGWRIALDRPQSLVARAARTGEGVIVNNVFDNPDYLPNPLLLDTRSEMAVPMIVGDEVIGVLDVQSERPYAFNEETVQIQTTLAAQIAVAVQNARQYEQTQAALAETKRQAQRMAMLNQISEKITVAGTLDEIYEIAASEATELFPSDRVTLSLLDETGEKAQVIAFSGDRGSVPVGVPQPVAGTLTEKAIQSRQAMVIHDPAPAPNRAINSSMIVPLISGTHVLGTINIGSKQLNQYDNQDENLTFQMASLLSAAIENQSLYAEQEATVKRLQELDELKSSFLANMSHELRTPLNSVIGFTDVMLEGLDGPLTDAMETDLKIIQSNGQHLLDLINDVLDMAKIEAGRMELSLGKINIYDMLNDVVVTTAPLAGEKELALDLNNLSDRSELEIEGDARRVKQVLLNVVSNAIKFTEKGSVEVEVGRLNELVQIKVKDTGAGIAPDQVEKIFEHFRQADNSATRKAGGTGLGLPISRRLVELHGGRLWVESTGISGEGSTFFVELPVEVKRSVMAQEAILA